jgi:hypothetical protein
VTDEVYGLLVAARDEFAEHGGSKGLLIEWLDRDYDCLPLMNEPPKSEYYQVCAMGAVNMAEHGTATWNLYEGNPVMKVRDLLNNHVPGKERCPKWCTPIVYYNNRDDVTQPDVLTVFDKAIAEYEEHHSA